MSGPNRVARTVVLLAGITSLVMFADEVVDWFLGLGLWILFFPHTFVASILVAGLAGALVTFPARRFMDGVAWPGLVFKGSTVIWLVISIAFVPLSK